MCLLLLLLSLDDCTGKAIAYLNQDKHYFHMFHHQGKSVRRCTVVLQICSTDLLYHFLDLNEIRTWAQGRNICCRQIAFYPAKNAAQHARQKHLMMSTNTFSQATHSANMVCFSQLPSGIIGWAEDYSQVSSSGGKQTPRITEWMWLGGTSSDHVGWI